MNIKKNFYSYFFFFLIIILIIDELSFILYNISLYQIFCGSNFIKIYESFFKLPIASLNNIDLVHLENIQIDNMFYELKFNIKEISYLEENKLISSIDQTKQLNTDSDNLLLHFEKNGANTTNIYLVHFDTLTTQKNKISFEILQNKIYICPGESTLAFFRITNLTNETIQAFSIYVVSPTEFTPFINKLQCFCYEELLLYPNETVDLPVLFRLENDLTRLDNINKELVIEYIIIF